MQDNLYFPLKERSIISISGADAKDFLQGLITNDINKASEEHAIYALMLTPQGKFLYDFFILEKDGKLILDCHKDKIPEIIKKFSMYKLRSDVLIEDLSDIYEVTALIGDKVFEDAKSTKEGHVKQFCKGAVYIDPRSKEIHARAFIEKENNYQSFHAYDYSLGDIEIYEEFRISNCIPTAELDFFAEKSFPHDFAMNDLGAIDYDKGCYVGQEVTARVNWRNKIKKKPYLITANEDQNLTKDIDIKTKDDKKLGSITSCFKNKAIAILNIEDTKNNGNIASTAKGHEVKIK